MDWRHLAVVAGLFSLKILSALGQTASENPECRLCPENCLRVPRSDGSCPVCVCNGVAHPDCPDLPDFCPRNCVMQRNDDGCNQCACRRENSVCPPLPACAEECQQLVDKDGCPRCICDAPPRTCPEIMCPDSCTEEVGSDGCISCRCQRTEICPALEPCLRGCIENDADTGCFFCNCTLLPEIPEESPDDVHSDVGPFGSRPSNVDPYEPRPSNTGPFDPRPSSTGPYDPRPSNTGPFDVRPSNTGIINARPSTGSFDVRPSNTNPSDPMSSNVASPNENPLRSRPLTSPLPRCRNERLFCPSDCRVAVADHGCRVCICGEDAYLCPGVPRCSNRCLFLSPEDKCCRCDCRGPRQPNGLLTITLIRVPPLRLGRPLGRPFGRPFARPFGRPLGFPGPFDSDIDFDDIPFLPPFSPRQPEKNCTVDPATCDPACRVIEDSDGCPLCDCPGDLCPRIRCPARCVRQIGLDGCPVCNCGGGAGPINPDAESVNPFAPPVSAAPEGPNGPGIPLPPVAPALPFPPVVLDGSENPDLPIAPVEPVNPMPPMIPEEPANPFPQAAAANPDNGGLPPLNPAPAPPSVSVGSVNPVLPMMPEEPANPFLPPASLPMPPEPINPVNPIAPTEQDVPQGIPQTIAEPEDSSLASDNSNNSADAQVASGEPENPMTNIGDIPSPNDSENPTITSADVFPVAREPDAPASPANPSIPEGSFDPNTALPANPMTPSNPFPLAPQQDPQLNVPSSPELPTDSESFFESNLRTGGSTKPAASGSNNQNEQNTPVERENGSGNPSFMNPDAQNIIPVDDVNGQSSIDSGLAVSP